MKSNFLKVIHFMVVVFISLSFFSCDENGDNGEEDDKSLPGKMVNAIYITEDGMKYFATENGLASFDGTEWIHVTDNPKITTGNINDMDHEVTSYGPEFWLGTDEGINVMSLPVDATSGATTYTGQNTGELFPDDPDLVGDSVFVVRVDYNHIRWFGTQSGLSVFMGDTWPVIDFGSTYSQQFFQTNRITSIDFANDTVYIGTNGAGVARFVAPSADAISGASLYEQPWSQIPSLNVLSVYTDGSNQWFGTDEGVAYHQGTEAKLNWTVYMESDGLVNEVVQAINKDNDGNIWLGTQGGVSMFDGSDFTNYTTADGLVSDNVISIAIDIDGTIWFGTDNGASHYNGTEFINYYSSDQ